MPAFVKHSQFLNAAMNRLRPSVLRHRRASKFLAEMIPSVTCIDVGAFGFPHLRWRTFLNSPRTRFVLVEPNIDGLKYVKAWKWAAHPDPHLLAVGQRSSDCLLYVTNVPTGSSLCRPRISESMAIRARKKDFDYLFPFKTTKVECEGFDSFINRLEISTPVVIKMDVQGMEFSCLIGVEHRIRSHQFIAIEVEASLLSQPFYDDATQLWQCQEFLQSAGYELVSLDVFRRACERSRWGSGIPAECDATFVIRADILARMPLEVRLLSLAIYLDYQLLDECRWIIDGLLEEIEPLSELEVRLRTLRRLLLKQAKRKDGVSAISTLETTGLEAPSTASFRLDDAGSVRTDGEGFLP